MQEFVNKLEVLPASLADDRLRTVIANTLYRDPTFSNYASQAVPRPPHWGGYRIIPERIEFWRAGSYRLHNRVLYTREGTGWRRELLYP